MISVDDRERIRRAYFLEHKSIRKIAKELKHSRDMVKKAIESAEPGGYTLRQPRRTPVLGSYLPRIDELLAESARLTRKRQYTGHKIYEQLQKEGLTFPRKSG
jgi:transposase